ncbi:HigB toxin protein [Leifsonia rubra CMS 76R]|nr:HigB toxin protein [Leifsonia rubra CMS 76R]
MIKSFRHKGLEAFFATGKKAGIRPDHANKLQRQLAVLDNARSIQDIPASWKPHALSGTATAGRGVDGHHAIWVSGNWRLVFMFEGTDVYLLDYLDYH